MSFKPIKAPFPWFGGKSRVAAAVWQRFGNVPNYVEPFAGSLAVLLGRPHTPKIETVNDKDCYLANFWRAVQHDPDAVARWADWPVNEIDVHARHRWLVGQDAFRDKMLSDPDYYDVKIAGWWIWGLSAWIGGGWCSSLVNCLPYMRRYGQGIHALIYRDKTDGTIAPLSEAFQFLQQRLRFVRVACGDWLRVLGETPTTGNGLTAVFLDPPYDGHESVYSEINTVAHDVGVWAKANGDNPMLRIAICGYDGDYELDGWDCVAWKANGGYSNQNKESNDNPNRERIWFSPHCLKQREQVEMELV